MDDRLNGLGDQTDQTNTVQYRARDSADGVERSLEGDDKSSETTPFLPGKKALGYGIRNYDSTTSATAGGTDLSFT
jgi:hypothetical protein